LKSQVFKRRLKASVEQVAVLRSVGRLFQALGAATENAVSPNRRLVRGYHNISFLFMVGYQNAPLLGRLEYHNVVIPYKSTVIGFSCMRHLGDMLSFCSFRLVVVVVVTFFNNNSVNCKAISNYGYQKYTK